MTKTCVTLLVLTAGVISGSQVAYASDPAHADQAIVPPAEAISRLKDGNSRYTNGNQQHPRQSTKQRVELIKNQHPFAIVVGCADSRVPPEIVFDQGLGDLFVLRVAGVAGHRLTLREYTTVLPHPG